MPLGLWRYLWTGTGASDVEGAPLAGYGRLGPSGSASDLLRILLVSSGCLWSGGGVSHSGAPFIRNPGAIARLLSPLAPPLEEEPREGRLT